MKRSLSVYLLVPLAASGLLFLACPSPLTKAMVDNARDLVPPVIQVLSPAEYASYSRVIAIKGTASDEAESGAAGLVRSLSYEIVSHTAPKGVTISSDGSFSIAEPNDLRENIVVLLHAVDWNGNATDIRLPLTWSGNEIPTFSSSEGNRQTTLSWDPVPGVSSYTLYMETSGLAPDPATSASVVGVSSPYTVSKLQNGKVYSFLLVGATADGKLNYSPVLRAIPLSRFNLFPSHRAAFNSIDLSWKTYPGISSYEVFRASSATGPYQSVSGAVSGNSWRDQGVSQGSTYYYEVRPSQYSTVSSWYVEASPDELPGRSDAYVGTVDGSSSPVNVAWSNGKLYVADAYYGLRIYDVSKPSQPIALGSVAISSAKDVAVSGNYAYVSGISGYSKKGLFVVDVSLPSSPVIVGFAEVPNVVSLQAEGVAVDGNIAVMAGFNDGFAVFDVTDKAHPATVLYNQDAALFGQNYGVAIQDRSGTKAIAVFGWSCSALYTLTGSPASPTLTKESSTLPNGTDGAFSGNTLFFASSWNLDIWNTTSLSSPTSVASYTVTQSVAPVQSIDVVGTRVYASLRDYGFATIDVSIPATPSTISIITVQGGSDGIVEGGGYAYVAGGYNGPVSVFGAGDTSGITVVRSLTGMVAGATIAPWRDKLFVTDYNNSSGNYDAYPLLYDAPSPLGTSYTGLTINPSYSPYAYAFAGDWAVIAAERSGVTMWNIANPSAPAPLGTYYAVPGGYAWSVAIAGPYAFVGTANSWLVSLDLSRDGTASVSASVITQPTVGANYELRDIALRDDGLAFVANEQGGLRVVDVSDPTYMIALSCEGFATAGYASTEAVALSGDYVLCADSGTGLNGGFLVFDAANARSWSSAVYPIWSSTGPAYDVKVSGAHAYVARGAAGLDIWDISNPRAPVLSGTIGGFSPTKIAVYKGALYALDGAGTLYAVDLTP